MSAQKLHYETMGALLVRRDGMLHWRCPDCRAHGASKEVLRTCPVCNNDKKGGTA